MATPFFLLQKMTCIHRGKKKRKITKHQAVHSLAPSSDPPTPLFSPLGLDSGWSIEQSCPSGMSVPWCIYCLTTYWMNLGTSFCLSQHSSLLISPYIGELSKQMNVSPTELSASVQCWISYKILSLMHLSASRSTTEELVLHLTASPRFTRFMMGSAFAHQFTVFQALSMQARRFSRI